jgi:hypothetical protein
MQSRDSNGLERQKMKTDQTIRERTHQRQFAVNCTPGTCSPLKTTLPGLLFLAALVLAAAPLTTQAQWLTQTIGLKTGWNAVFLNVDASQDTLDEIIGGDRSNPIQEIWRWAPASVTQFTESPAEPTPALEWTTWNRTNTGSASLLRLIGDSAYLVRVATNVATYNWSIKGHPVAPRHEWSISGLNLLGFSTVTNSPPNFRAFLAQATEFLTTPPEIYYYPGGDLGSNNPALLPSILQPLITVKRGQAFWIRSGTVFNHYFGPFEVVQAAAGGVDFRENSSSSTFRLRNLTSSNLTVTLRLVNSEPSPIGQTAIAAAPPLLLRGSALNLTNLTYGYTNLPVGAPRTWTLAPRNQAGSEVQVVLGLNRAAIAQPPGSLLAGILRFSDSLGFSQVDLPVSATAASGAGLWVGTATINQVGQYLVTYARGGQTNYLEAANGERTVSSIATNQLVRDENGHYLATGTDTSLTGVPRPFSGRLIVHNPTNGNAVLLQRVYYGFDPDTNVVIASSESALHPGYLKNARRISSTFLPWTAANTRWPLSGNLGQGLILSNTMPVTLPYSDQAANPFLHTYHTDHDNLNATFDAVLPQGVESYTVERAITLSVQAPAEDFASIVTGAQTLTGGYQETITIKGLGSNHREYRVSGGFTLNRISPVPLLTVAP